MFVLQQLYLATGNAVNYEEDLQVATTIDPQAGLAMAEPMPCPGNESPGQTILCSSNLTQPTNSLDDIPNTNTVWNAAGEQLCVVCQYFPLSRALLPCRYV